MACIIHDVLDFQYPKLFLVSSSFSHTRIYFFYAHDHCNPPKSIFPLTASREIKGKFEELKASGVRLSVNCFFEGDCLLLFLGSPNFSSFNKSRALLIKQMTGLLSALFPLEFWKFLGRGSEVLIFENISLIKKLFCLFN